MGRFRSRSLSLAIVIAVIGGIAACGGGKKNIPLFPGKITVSPTGSTSLVLGQTLSFAATVQTTSGTTLAVPIAYSSSNTSILNMSPSGVACAGQWSIGFTSCTPGGTGVVQITANALGATSIPTYVFVHAPIDSVTVSGILLNGVPVQEPCLSQSQSMALEAHAFSEGTDITSSVGPFTWSADNPTVVTFTPIVNQAYTFATNQVTATAAAPGIAHIYATAGGVSNTSFQQPSYTNSQNLPSPLLDFFSTCPVQSISLEVGAAGSGQTNFVVSKGTSETAVATITDAMGNSTLPNTNGQVVLSKVPLTWTASQPAVLDVATSCTNTCALTTASPGAGTITASCSPPTCNAGFPFVPASLSTPAQIAACTQFFHAEFPQFTSCQELIPAPVYATPLVVSSTGSVQLQPPTGAISGVITGTPTSPSVIAASFGCEHEVPTTCSTSVYDAAKGTPGNENPLPVAANSFLFDLVGDKLYMGSDFGAQAINPASFGTTNSPFSSFGTVTGKILAVSANGAVPLFADNVHTPNQVYVVNSSSSIFGSGGNTAALNISSAVAAAFSPDGLKAFIIANGGSSLYVYSQMQALQGPIALSGSANSVAFDPSGAFAFVAAASAGTATANVTAYATCNNQVANNGLTPPVAATVTLPGNPILMKVLPNMHLDGRDSYGNLIPDGIHVLVLDSTGFDILTATLAPAAAGTLCPGSLSFISHDPARLAQRVELGEGTLEPVNFFASPDGTQLYVVSSGSSSIFVYSFITGGVTGGIEMVGNALPLSADMAIDAGTIVVAGTDGMIHEISTALGGADAQQISFPNLPDYLNPFCTFTPSSGPCTLSIVLAKP